MNGIEKISSIHSSKMIFSTVVVFAFIFFVHVSGSSLTLHCPPGWNLYAKGELCVYISPDLQPRNDSVNFSEAQERCKEMGGDLLQIHDSSTNEFFSSLAAASQFLMWFGIIKENKTDSAHWSTGEKVTGYTSWASNLPFIGPEAYPACSVVWGDVSEWYFFNCSFKTSSFACGMYATHRAPFICSPGWTQYGQQCYKVYAGKPLSRDSAQAYCQDVNSSLAEIPDSETQNFIWNTFKSKLELKDAWIYYKDRNRTDIFTDRNGKEISFTNWGFGRPRSHGRLDCVLLWKLWEGKWTDDDCDQKYNFICQRPTILADIHCDDGWDLLGDEKTCLKEISVPGKWSDGDHQCRLAGGFRQVQIYSSVVNDYIAARLRGGSDYWIGLHQYPGDAKRWGRELPAFYLNLENKTEWNQGSETCGYMTKGQTTWKAGDCLSDKRFLCETFAKAKVDCVDGSIPLLEKNACIKVHLEEPKFWQVARQECTIFNDNDLVTITDVDMTRLLSDVILSYNGVAATTSYWIGLHSPHDKATFQWLDSTAELNYSNWGAGQPNNTKGDESCVFIEGWSDDQPWLNDDCSVKKPFICQTKAYSDGNTDPKIGYECGDEHWVHNMGVCYRLEHSSRRTWFEARRHCMSFGADLVKADDIGTTDFLADHIAIRATGSEYWIGLNGIYDGNGRWIDGSPLNFQNFGESLQDDKGGWEKCVTMRADGKWSDKFCGERFAFICSKEVKSTTSSYPQGGCPPGFRGTPSSSWCFQLKGVKGEDRKTFDDALEDCRLTNFPMSRLASIHSNADQNIVTSLIPKVGTPVWIGLRQKFYDHQYDFVDNTRLRYSNWGHNQPEPVSLNDPELKMCVMMTSGQIPGSWVNVPCGFKLPFICETPKEKKLPLSTNDQTCQSGYQRLRDYCYRIHDVSKTWSESKGTCANEGGEMVEILDGFDAAYVNVLADNINATEVWIGLSKNSSGEFTWQGGRPVDFSLLTHGVSASTLRCGVHVANDGWMAADCQEKRPFVCQVKNALPVTTTPTPQGPPTRTWMKFDKIYHYYVELEHKKTWPEAEYACTQMNASLVSFSALGNLGIFYPELLIFQMTIWVGLQRQYAYTFGNGSSVSLDWKYGLKNVSEADKRFYHECSTANRNSLTGGDFLQYSDCFVPRAYVCEIIKGSSPTIIVNSTETPAKLNTDLSPGSIAGIVVGVLGTCLIIVCVIFVLMKRCKNIRHAQDTGMEFNRFDTTE